MSLRIFFFLKGAIMRRPLFLVCICMIPIACSSPTAPTKSIQITTVSWFYENNPPDRNNGHLNMGITVYYSGSSIQTNDLCSLVITTPSLHWKLLAGSNGVTVNDSSQSISVILYSNALSNNASVLPIDSFFFNTTLNNGASTSKAISIFAPGMTSANGNKFTYSQDYSGSVPVTFVQTIRRPTVDSCYLSNNSILIKFKINDSLFYNGFVWFYNSSGTYIGGTSFFRNLFLKTLSQFINSGSTLYSDSLNDNLAVIGTQDCVFGQPYSFKDIYSVRVVTTDGRQYQSVPNSGYSYRSVSPLVNLSKASLSKKINVGKSASENMPDYDSF